MKHLTELNYKELENDLSVLAFDCLECIIKANTEESERFFVDFWEVFNRCISFDTFTCDCNLGGSNCTLEYFNEWLEDFAENCAKCELYRLFENDDDLFIETIEELDNYNGWLNDDRCYNMCDFDDFFCGCTPTEIIERIDNGFSSCDDYFYFNGYGYCVSTNYKDYSDYLDDYFIKEVIDTPTRNTFDSEVIEILERFEM